MRAARGILPNITRVKGCIYNCDPEQPHCPQHKNMTAEELAALGTEEIPMPFLEISHSAKVGTVAGSIDLSRLTDKDEPEARLLPGLIPKLTGESCLSMRLTGWRTPPRRLPTYFWM